MCIYSVIVFSYLLLPDTFCQKKPPKKPKKHGGKIMGQNRAKAATEPTRQPRRWLQRTVAVCLASGYDGDMTTHQQTAETRSYDTLDYTADLDDRVCCNGCPNSTLQPQQQFVQADTIHKDKPLRTLPGDVVTRSGKWVVLTWQALHCKAMDAPAMQAGVMHRCAHIKPPGYADMHPAKKTPQKPVKSIKSAAADNWWEA